MIMLEWVCRTTEQVLCLQDGKGNGYRRWNKLQLAGYFAISPQGRLLDKHLLVALTW